MIEIKILLPLAVLPEVVRYWNLKIPSETRITIVLMGHKVRIALGKMTDERRPEGRTQMKQWPNRRAPEHYGMRALTDRLSPKEGHHFTSASRSPLGRRIISITHRHSLPGRRSYALTVSRLLSAPLGSPEDIRAVAVD